MSQRNQRDKYTNQEIESINKGSLFDKHNSRASVCLFKYTYTTHN
jgi:hypothetical protein